MAKLRIAQSFKEKDLNRSVYSLDQNKITTFMQGLNIPVKFEKMMPKDSFTVDYRSMIESMPLEGRQFNDWKLRIMLFQSDLANYYSWMDNNSRLSSVELKNKRHHTISSWTFAGVNQSVYQTVMGLLYPEVTENGTSVIQNMRAKLSVFLGVDVASEVGDNAQKNLGVQPNSLLDHIEIPVGYIQPFANVADDYSTVGQNFNADFILCYLDAVRNYLVNNQLESVPYFVPYLPVLSSAGATTGRIKSYIGSINLKAIDWYLKSLRMQDDGVDILKFMFDGGTLSGDAVLHVPQIATWLCCLRFGGLFLAQYERDMLNSLLYNVDTTDINVDISNGSFSINQLRLKNREQLRQDRFDVSGGRWKNLLRTVWGVDDNSQMDIPRIVGASSYYLSAKSVMSQSNTEREEVVDGETVSKGSALGQMAGVFNTNDLNTHKFKVYTSNHSIFFAIASIVPDVVYCNGLGKYLDKISFDDEYYPQFDQIGFEDVPRFRYNALPSKNPETGRFIFDREGFFKPVGKNIAFIELISNVNRCHGKFSGDAYFGSWVLRREFIETTPAGVERPVDRVTSYVNPLEWQYPFIAQGADNPNFIFQIGFDIRAVRSKGKYFMPTLGK